MNERRILVVEDSVTQAEQLRCFLESAGYAVELAANGKEGLLKARMSRPDLIISDILMPELDGFTFCQAVKSDPATRDIPFVVLTVLNTPVDVVVGLERGADNFITKPFHPDYLLERVQSILHNLELRRESAASAESIVRVAGRKITVSAHKQQIVELLVAILDDLGRVSRELVQSQELIADYRERLHWLERTREALDRNRFVLFAQPILDLRRDRVTTAELLLRMLGEDGGTVPPERYLPVAEHVGLIREIDRWVVRRALSLSAELARRGWNLQLSMNLSARSLASEELLTVIRQALADTSADATQLVFEMTETAVITNMLDATRFVGELKDLGFRFAIDDFGVGFTTFDHLKQLPADYVKIDGSFIRNLRRSPVDRHLVKAMVEVARSLDKATIAEFVEDKETLELLRELGVDYGQGCYIGRPGPVEELYAGSSSPGNP